MTTAETPPTVEALRALLPEAAKDIKLNLQSILSGPGSLTNDQKWGVAIASAIASRSEPLRAALVSDSAVAGVEAKVVEDAKAAAAITSMNNIYYRFRHMIGKQTYSDKPARLRMNRLSSPTTTRADLELFSLAVSAIHGCERCVRAHEEAVLERGISEDQVHDTIRLAAVIHGAAVALDEVVRGPR
ncbi:carboxymuconolactone decarboxylase family protein [Pendulispora albinea]|uniref:Alkyl hydroperoxide reductase AhpD n=1 Tax=Pendulispora albinea TaxID=2741071 RepID=A0ABZ2LZC4_9BACT